MKIDLHFFTSQNMTVSVFTKTTARSLNFCLRATQLLIYAAKVLVNAGLRTLFKNFYYFNTIRKISIAGGVLQTTVTRKIKIAKTYVQLKIKNKR